MKHILLFEPSASGHRMVYVRYLIDAMQVRGGLHAYLAVGSGSLDHPQLSELRAAYSSSVTILPVELNEVKARHGRRFRGFRRILKQYYWVKAINSLLGSIPKEKKVDYLFIPFVDDYCLYVAALHPRPFGSLPWGGIAVRPRHHLRACAIEAPFRWVDLVERFLYRRLLCKPSMMRLFAIDPYFCNFYSHPKLSHVSDPAELSSSASTNVPPELRAFAREGRVVLLVYGYIDGRKGLETLFPVAIDPSIPCQLHIILAGRQDNEILPILASPAAETLRLASRITEINRELSDAEEAAMFELADIVWVYYPRSYCSSGALVRAGQRGKPVIATREGLVGRLVTDLAMGKVASEDDPDEVRVALALLSNSVETRKACGQAGRAYFSASTAEAFSAPVISQIVGAINV